MDKKKYKKSENKNYSKHIIVLGILIFILLIINNILSGIYKKNNEENTKISYENLSNVKEVIEYYESKYISEEESKEANFNLDIYLNFAKMPYEDDEKSNEEYYNKMIEDIAKVINYASFRMFDHENDIKIEVLCENKKIKTMIINGMEDYFIYHDSQISMKNYEEIGNTEFIISSPILQSLIDNAWDSNIDLGTRESIFDDYHIFFDEGIKARIIDNKVYNIVFDKNYGENVINTIFPGIDLRNVKSSLGEPTFENDDLKIIGYKNQNIYVFFSENEISIYRKNQTDTDDFFKLADEYLEKKIDLLEFMNKLTYMWPDYSEYQYTTTSVFISYPLKGIEIKVNYDDTNGILVYNNIKSSLSKINRYMEKTEFVGKLQLDSVFEAEKRRLITQNSLKTSYDEYISGLDKETKDIVGESLKYGIIPQLDENNTIYSIKFISLQGNAPNRQLNDSIDSYLWINNDTLVYSKKTRGIFSYDLNTGTVKRIVSGKENYVLKSYEEGKLKYDKTEIDF